MSLPASTSSICAGGGAVLRQLDLPFSVWASGPPPHVLQAFTAQAARFTDVLTRAAPADLHGAAFRCEVWLVKDVAPGTARRSEVMADAASRRIRLRPDRVEARTFVAVDRAGVTCTALLERGETEVQRSVAFPGAGKHPGGGIPSALDQLVTAMLGVTIPARKG
jgi:hypothetical protein